MTVFKSLNAHLSVHYLDSAHFLIDAQHCQQTYGCLRSVSTLNTLDTSLQCITGLVSAREQLSKGRGQIMHEPKASTLSALDRYLIVLAH